MIDAAIKLATLGYAVFPCAPNQKRPATRNGLLDASADPETVEAMFKAAPANCNLAIRTDGLLVVDVDGSQNPWLTDQPDKLAELSDSPLSLTPRGGKHFIYRQPDGRRFRNTAGKLADKVDTRGDGGYILVPPSVVDGKPYRWGTPIDCEPEALPLPPAWLVELLIALDANRRGNLSPAGEAKPGSANRIPDGQRNGTLTRLAGSMRRRGMSYAAILALKAENQERCKPPLEPAEVEIIASSVARYAPDQLETAIAEDHAGQDGLIQSAKKQNSGDFPGSLLRVPGFIDAVVEFNLAGAVKPQPVLALAGALCLLSVLTGRKITDPYGTRTNLYCLAVGESGCGKERARKVNKDILHQAGLDRLIGPEGIASHSGLVGAVQQQPAILFQLDEIGRMLKTLGNAAQSPHLYNIATVLMKLFTSADSVYKGDAYADSKKNVTIFQPHAVVYGTTVPKSLHDGLTSESLSDGFLSRMLIFESADNDPEAVQPVAIEVPPRLIDEARFWGDLRTGGNLSTENPRPIAIDYTQSAIERLGELESLSRAERTKTDRSMAALWTRTTEKARKLAILWACSESREQPLIGYVGTDWAAQVSEFLTRKMLEMAELHVSENTIQANRKRLLRTIQDAGEAGLTQAELSRKTQWIRARERQEILDDLLLAGQIQLTTIATATRSRNVYIA